MLNTGSMASHEEGEARKRSLVMMRPSIGSLLLASTLAFAGCADGTTAAPTQDLVETEETFSVGSIDPELLGTFRGQAVEIGELTLLALKSDGSFHYGMAIVCAALPEPCGPAAEDGYYKLTQREDDRYLELYNKKSILRARFQYALADDTLRMRRTDTGGGEWRSMVRADKAWCALPSDCNVQNLKGKACAGDWECASDACEYSCKPHLEVEEPACMFDGSEHEGWYLSDGAQLLCHAKCAGASLRCSEPSSTSEGYHAVMGEGCEGSLVMRGSCSF
jgi:hypothetical protein